MESKQLIQSAGRLARQVPVANKKDIKKFQI